MPNNYLNLYLIADTGICSATKILALLPDLIGAGVSCVQLRMKGAATAEIENLGRQLLTILLPRRIPLIINDDITAAHNIKAQGVHIGQQDIAYQQARQILGPESIIGLSIENMEQALRCKHYSVNYFGVGPIFATTTKLDASPALGVSELVAIKQVLNATPLVAIGGINKSNCQLIRAQAQAGIAVAKAILGAPNPILAAQELV